MKPGAVGGPKVGSFQLVMKGRQCTSGRCYKTVCELFGMEMHTISVFLGLEGLGFRV